MTPKPVQKFLLDDTAFGFYTVISVCSILSGWSTGREESRHCRLCGAWQCITERQEKTMGFMGLDFKSREEREREEKDYLYRIFPGGNEQKAAVRKELAARIPWEDSTGLMLYYVLVRDAMTLRDGKSFEEAVALAAKKQRMINATPEILKVLKAVMEENS